ncbi:MAG: hypothetical protein LBC14_05130 [Desulfovibrio sp.]|jgi:hypothetical protein|nr:hypothetical protein [Desulfovibrio sp.]
MRGDDMRNNVCFFQVRAYPVQEAEDYRQALKQPAVRRIFRSLLGVSNVFGPSLGVSAQYTGYNEGLRAAGLLLAAKIEQAAPGATARLMLESVEDRPDTRANPEECEEDY